jgi:hypothetical protein
VIRDERVRKCKALVVETIEVLRYRRKMCLVVQTSCFLSQAGAGRNFSRMELYEGSRTSTKTTCTSNQNMLKGTVIGLLVYSCIIRLSIPPSSVL